MCGIAGILSPDPNQYTLHDLQRMTDSLAHRGPDAAGHWRSKDGTVLLGHRRLKIIDPSDRSDQPFQSFGRYILIHNGEIYNYLEIRKELSQKGYSFRSESDTEVIAAAYDHWKSDCVMHFDGMFAFALWDEQEQCLFAARDRFGEKPFYYSLQGQSLLFASEIKAFWSLGIQKETDPRMAFNYLTLGYVDDPTHPDRTFFSTIHKLPPAHRLTYSAIYRTATIERYWDMDVRHTQTNISDQEAESQFLELLQTSVQRRLRSDVPIGCSLSGGLDSSTLATLISQHQTQPVQTFTAVFPGFEHNEEAAATLVSNQIKARPHLITLNETDWFQTGIECMRHQDEPIASSSSFAQFAVYRAIAETGIKVVIDGQGADETLAGYDKYYTWYWQELFKKRDRNKAEEIRSARAMGVDVSFDWRHKLAAYFPDLAAHQRKKEYHKSAQNNSELSRSWMNENIKQLAHTLPEHPGLNGALYFNTCTHGLEELLRYADRNAMRFGLEVRLPFLSHYLVEFLFSLPSHFKIRQGWRKWILRHSMENQLPNSILWNAKKIGYETPQADWMQQPIFKEAIQEARSKLVRAQILHESVLKKPIRPQGAHEADPKDWRYFSLASLFD